ATVYCSGSMQDFLPITRIRHDATRAKVRFALIYGWQWFGRSVVEHTLAIENGQRVGHHQDRIWRLAIRWLARVCKIIRLSHSQRLRGDSNRSSSRRRGFVTQ